MKNLMAVVCVMVLTLAFGIMQAGAQEAMSAGSIVEALKSKPKTRSLTDTSTSGMTNGQSQFVDRLRSLTREIVVEERKQLAKIVEQQKLPSIDLEIYFEVNSDHITGHAQPALVELGRALQDAALNNAIILLSGHTDATGAADHNQGLSERRAAAVKAFLVKTFHISPSRVIAAGYGEEQLKNAGQPDAAENRRVQIVNLVK